MGGSCSDPPTGGAPFTASINVEAAVFRDHGADSRYWRQYSPSHAVQQRLLSFVDRTEEDAVSGRILVGSCSWTDPSLISSGRFYPSGVSSPEARLRYYATRFPIVEVDATYYAPPSRRNSELWAARTPAGFVFDVKAFALLTGHPAAADRLPSELRGLLPPEVAHKRRLYGADLDEAAREALWELHRDALAPLADAGKLGAVLFQFPPWFVRSSANRSYVESLGERLPGWTVAVEFRGGGWMEPDAAASSLAMLERAGLAYVSVDEPQLERTSTPPVVAATAPLAYIRLHGRNADTWNITTGAASDRFKYLYSDDELEEWAPLVQEVARRAETVHVLFNNNYEDWGMRNARRMAQILGVETAPGDPQPGLGTGGRQERLDLDG